MRVLYVLRYFPTLTETPTDSIDGFNCPDGVRLAADVLLCAAQNAVVYDEPDVHDLYVQFGDFTLGYFYGIAWAERAQQLQGSTLQGERRALLDDCYTGAWVRDITPDPNTGLPTRTGDRDGHCRRCPGGKNSQHTGRATCQSRAASVRTSGAPAVCRGRRAGTAETGLGVSQLKWQPHVLEVSHTL